MSKPKFQNGDWVIYRDGNDQILLGYVDDENFKLDNPYMHKMKIRVTQDESGKAEKKSYELQVLKNACKLSNPPGQELEFFDEGSILNLIDIALISHDKAAFEELTEQLQAMRNYVPGIAETPSYKQEA